MNAEAAAWIESPEIGVRGVAMRKAHISLAVVPEPEPVASVPIPQLTVVPGDEVVGPNVIVAEFEITDGLAVVGVLGEKTCRA